MARKLNYRPNQLARSLVNQQSKTVGLILTNMQNPILTRAAEAQIARLMARGGTQGLRIGLKKGGCAGMEYTMEYVAEVSPTDEVVEQNGARVMIAPMAQMFLFGTEMDFEQTTLRTGFTFRNPNQSSACGCGESVELKPADLKVLAEARAQSAA